MEAFSLRIDHCDNDPPSFPHPVDLGLALGTLAVLEVVAPDGVPQPFDEQLLAGIAVGVLAALSRDVADVDIAQAGLEADLPGPDAGWPPGWRAGPSS